MKLSEKKQTFGFRKLSVGLASVALATTFLVYGTQEVHADEIPTEENAKTEKTTDVKNKGAVENPTAENETVDPAKAPAEKNKAENTRCNTK